MSLGLYYDSVLKLNKPRSNAKNSYIEKYRAYNFPSKIFLSKHRYDSSVLSILWPSFFSYLENLDLDLVYKAEI